VDGRQRQDLDRYITGNYGENKFQGEGDIFEPLTVHEEYWAHQNREFAFAKMYDPTDDGPEVEVITVILAHDWYYEIEKERLPNSYPEAAL
jgi:hypothetical protein